MPLTLTQVSVTSTATELVTVEPGQTVTLCASASTAVGTANTVTTSGSGGDFTLPQNVPMPFTVPNVQGAASVTLYGITASSSTVSVAVTENP